MPAQRLLISAGEASGDLHAAELLRVLRTQLPELETFGLGGDLLQAEGTRLVAHVRDLAVVGLAEVLRHLTRLRRTFRQVLEQVEARRPDLAVLLDYPDFNLRLARELKQRGVPVVYYISPQVWAWRRGRLAAIRQNVARMLVLFPFELPLYEQAGVPVTFVGHPLVESVRPEADPAGFRARHGLDGERPVLAVLPGSRPQEIAHNLPVLAAGLRRLSHSRPDVQPVVARASSLDPATLLGHLGGLPVKLVGGQTTAVLSVADAALVASGTATVETAILGTPMAVVYRLSRLTYLLGRPFVRVPHFAMVNLIAGKRVVPELIQGQFTPERVEREARRLLEEPAYADAMRGELAEVRRRLGEPGASARAARAVLEELRRRPGPAA